MNTMIKKSLLLGVSALAVVMSVAMSSNMAVASAVSVGAATTASTATNTNDYTFNVNDGVLTTGDSSTAISMDGAISIGSGITGSTISAGENTTLNTSTGAINLGATGILLTNAKTVTVATSKTLTVGTAKIGIGTLTVTGTLAAPTVQFTGDGTLTISATTGTATSLTAIKTDATNTGTVAVNHVAGVSSSLAYGSSDKVLKKVTFTEASGTFDIGAAVYATNTAIGANTTLQLSKGASINGALDGSGSLVINSDQVTGGDVGAATALTLVTVNASDTYSVNHNLKSTNITLNSGSSLKFGTSGTPTVTVTGAIDGSAASTGAITVAAGTTTFKTAVGNTKTLGSFTVANGATAELEAVLKADAVTVAGTLKTKSAITAPIDGAGTYVVTGTHTTGGTIGATTALGEINVGSAFVLTLAKAAKASKFTLAGSAAGLTIDAGGSYSGPIDGSVAGNGVVTINDTTVNSGGAIGSTFAIATLKVNDTMTFNANHAVKTGITELNGTSGTLNVNVAGSDLGSIKGTVADNGILNINANTTIGTAFNNKIGQINISNSTLTATAAFNASTVTVKDGGILKLADVDVTAPNAATVVNSGGTVDVGGKTLTITAGSLTLEKGSTYKFKLTGAGGASGSATTNTGHVAIATGAVTVQSGANFEVDAGDQLIEDGKYYKVASGGAAATVVGTPKKEYGLVTYEFLASTYDVLAKTTVRTMDQVAGITGSRLVGTAAAVQGAMTNGAIATQLRVLQSYTAPQIEAALKTFDGATNFAAVQSAASTTSNAHGAIDANAGSAAIAVAELVGAPAQGHAVAAGNVVPAAAAAGSHGLEAWGQLLGATEDQSRRESYEGYKGDTVGFTLGVTGHIMDGLKAGLAFTYADSKIKEKLNASKTDSKSYLLSLYGTYSPMNTWFVDGIFTGASNKYEAKRLDLLGTLYNSDFGGNMLSASFKGGYNVKVGDGMVFSPFVAVKGGTTKIDAYTESGGAAPMAVSENSINSMQAGLGARVVMTTKAMEGWNLSPQFNVAWMHEFNDKARTVNATWVGQPMQVKTAKFASEIITGGVGLKAASDTGTSVSLDYSFTAKNSFVGHTGLLRVGYNF